MVTVPANHDFRIGDVVLFTAKGTATLDTGLPAGGQVKVIAKPDSTHIEIGDVNTGAPTTLVGDATGSNAGNHTEISLADFQTVCQVREWSLDLTKESIETTTLPCAVGTASKYAKFRTSISGYASGEGSLSVMFTADQTSLANRLLANSILQDSTAEVKLYVSAVAGTGSTVDDTQSSYFQGKVNLQGFSVSVNPDDVTVAEISFSLAEQPTAIFGVTL